jgi:hypothetical protein
VLAPPIHHQQGNNSGSGSSEMARRALSALLLAALACDVAYAKFGRHSFPEGFVFGTGSASYQVMIDAHLCCTAHYY